ncbi:MAG: hypothetical protein ACRD3M_06285 [Thermoanaerobaculia bacterium]
MVKTSIKIPDKLWEAAKVIAAMERKSLADVIAETLSARFMATFKSEAEEYAYTPKGRRGSTEATKTPLSARRTKKKKGSKT